MARSRNIKPGFFQNDLLAEIDPLGRLLFSGLWTIADRAGRLEDRPKRIKAAVLPYDECNIDELLDELSKRGFIQRYRVSDSQYIVVKNFTKHQNPHCKEPESTIPAPDKNSTDIVQEPDENRSSLADSLNLISDSPSPASDADASVVGSKLTDDQSAARKNIPDCPHQEIIELYKKHLPTLAAPRIWQGKKVETLRARWRWVLTGKKANGDRYATDLESGLGFFDRFFAYAAESDFLSGRNGSWRRCDLAWLINAENFLKVLEGKYHDREAAA